MSSLNIMKTVYPLLYRNEFKISRTLINRGYKRVTEKEPIEVEVFDFSSKKTSLYCWGYALTGALGEIKVGNRRDKANYCKRPMYKIMDRCNQINDVSCGVGFTIYAIEYAQGPRLLGSGLNKDGQLGHQSVRGPNHPLEIIYSTVFIKNAHNRLQKKETFIKVAAGRNHSLALTSDGTVLSFGCNQFGQCGKPIVKNEDNRKFKELWTPKLNLENGDQIIDIECGLEHSLFLTKYGKVYSCGQSSDGQTGLGNNDNVAKLTLVEGDIKNEKIVKLSSSADTVLAINDKGEAFGWGNSEYFQLPLEDHKLQVFTPRHLPKLKKLGKISDIASSGCTSMALTDGGDVFVWGYGILGKGPDSKHSTDPTQIPNTLFGRTVFHPDTRVISIYCGIQSMAAVTNTGELFMWGKNKLGQLGLGHTQDQYYPLNVCIGVKVLKVSCGIDHTMAICEPF